MSLPLPVRIVGGGLAGLALGIGLGRAGVPATVSEAGDYPRHRVCGEFLAGLDAGTIARLGIGDALVGARLHLEVTWFRRGHAFARHALPVPARAISRFALDARLAEQFVAGGGDLLARARHAPPPAAPGWVDARGRSPNGASPWVGLKLHVQNLVSEEGLEIHLGDQAYVGVSPVEGGWTNVCGLFRRRADLHVERGHALVGHLRASGLGQLADRLAGAPLRPGSACAVAGFAFARRVACEPGLLLGDAGGMIPPFTGNGMTIALTGAALALDPLIAWSRGGCTWEVAMRDIRQSLRAAFAGRLRRAARLHPFLLHPPLQLLLGMVARTGFLTTALLYRLLH